MKTIFNFQFLIFNYLRIIGFCLITTLLFSCQSKKENNQENIDIKETTEQVVPENTQEITIASDSVKEELPIISETSKKEAKKEESNSTVTKNEFDMYETETYLIVYGEIQHIEIIDKTGLTIVSEDMSQAISTKKLIKGETYKVYITAKDGKKAIQSFTKAY